MLWFLLTYRVAILVHECGHARVSEARTTGDVWIDWGRGKRWLTPRAVSRFLRLPRTDLWIGIIFLFGGRTGHGAITDRQHLIELYSAGYRANFRWASKCTVAALLGLCLVAAAGAPEALIWVPAIAAVSSALNGLENRLIEREPSADARDGSDAWNLVRLRADPTFQPPHPPTAAEIRSSRGVPLASAGTIAP